MTEEKKVKPKKKLWIFIVAPIAIVLIAAFAIFTPKSAGAKNLEEYLDLGDKYLNELNYEQAIINYLAAIEIDPKNAEAYLGLIDAYNGSGDYAMVEKVLNDALIAGGSEFQEEIVKKINESLDYSQGSQPEQASQTSSQEQPTQNSGASKNIVPEELVGTTGITGYLMYCYTQEGVWILSVNDYYISEIIIPETIGGYPVLGITFTNEDDSPLSLCTELEKITIPNNMVYVWKECFSGCDVSNITIGCSENHPLINTLKDIGFVNFDFSYNAEIPEITDSSDGLTWDENPDGTLSVRCTDINVTNVVIPNEVNGKTVTTIGSEAFFGCIQLQSVVIPDSVTIINDAAFSGCISLQNIEMSDNITTIGKYAFSGCSSLQEIEIPSGVTTLEDNLFSRCAGLVRVEIPYSVTYIGDMAFDGCYSLSSVEIPNSVTHIGWSAFSGSGLTEVIIPRNVTFISAMAFSNCASLSTVEIMNGDVSLGDEMFSYCYMLEAIYAPSDSYVEYYCYEYGYPFVAN